MFGSGQVDLSEVPPNEPESEDKVISKIYRKALMRGREFLNCIIYRCAGDPPTCNNQQHHYRLI